MWNVDLQRDLTRTINVGVGYAGTRGASLDIQRAPNRGANGVADRRRPAVHLGGIRAATRSCTPCRCACRSGRRRASAAALSYTLSKSRDNASTLGGGGGTVAQNDKDLEAEWGASSFDQRHRFSANVNVELPFGPQPALAADAALGDMILGGWHWTTNVTLASGTPFTARVTGARRQRGPGPERHAARQLQRRAPSSSTTRRCSSSSTRRRSRSRPRARSATRRAT